MRCVATNRRSSQLDNSHPKDAYTHTGKKKNMGTIFIPGLVKELTGGVSLPRKKPIY